MLEEEEEMQLSFARTYTCLSLLPVHACLGMLCRQDFSPPRSGYSGKGREESGSQRAGRREEAKKEVAGNLLEAVERDSASRRRQLGVGL